MAIKIHVFRTGTHTPAGGQPITFTESMLRASVEAYDPKKWEAPLVIGHPKHDDPAFGWVERVEFDGADYEVVPRDVNPKFVESVGKKEFKNVSVRFYAPDDPHNPVPGVYYLRHVGFFGAAPTAVKGLRQVQFEDGDAGLEFVFGEDAVQPWDMRNIASVFRGLRDMLIDKYGQADADAIIPPWRIEDLERSALRMEDSNIETGFNEPTTEEVKTMNEKELKEEKARLEQQQAAFAEEKEKFEQQQKDARRQAAARRKDEAIAFAEGLVEQGTILPAHKPVIADVLVGIDDASTVEFGEGDARTSRNLAAAFKEFLGKLPKKIEFGEVAGTDRGEPPAAGQGEDAEFSEDLSGHV